MLVLTEKLADIHAQLFDYKQKMTQDEMITFLQAEFGRIGADLHITPREVIRDFIAVLDISLQNPSRSIAEIIGTVAAPAQTAASSPENDDDFAEFEI